MSLVAAVLAAAVMFGIGFGMAYLVASLLGRTGTLAAPAGFVAGALSAGYSLHASARRIARSRRRDASPA
jgi:hypothetical protein